MSYTCDRCGHEFEVPKLVESGGEYGGTTHKEPASPCCEHDFKDINECEAALRLATIKTIC